MSYQFLQIQTHDTITEITLNRPDKRNALTYEMINELIAAFQEVGASEALGIILNANGSVFCAGHDYADMLSRDLAGMRDLMHKCSEMMQLIHTLPQPVIASVQGLAIGAGCQLALTCDLVVASEQAGFRTPGNSRGWFCFTPMVAVSRAIGRKRALEMLLTGDIVSAEQAAVWGMVNRVVPAEQLAEATLDLAQRATRGSRVMMALGKEAYYAQVEWDEAQAYKYAAEVMASTGTMPDAQARMRAFTERKNGATKTAVTP
jgi:enoyl-CoA hydratase/carnithine racemase